ncbi:FAD-binding oxidoreductase [Halalkalibacter lacteus]|uniref:FAD-binding oxidoreductase n=1 Tax=Halalkalibacter lacteus TaxID=3090663 RepID=UPI002FCB44C5
MNRSITWLNELAEVFDADMINMKDSDVKRMSQDYYWYSPILKKQLENRYGDCVIAPRNENELIAVLSFAAKKKISLISRGGGTGNYGQIIPLDGGIVLDTSKLNQTIEIKEGKGTFQAGIKLGMIERTLRESNQELRFFPSTFMKSTLAGFIAGGTGGIGSIEYGTLWDEENKLALTIITMEETPRNAEHDDIFSNYVQTNKLRVSDFNWNHVTLWWLKQHNNDTYLQGRFHLDHYLQQVKHYSLLNSGKTKLISSETTATVAGERDV